MTRATNELHCVNHEMIDAAVKSANEDKLHQDYGGWLALNKLNIFKCEDCVKGKFGTEVCSTCSGHDWTIHDAP